MQNITEVIHIITPNINGALFDSFEYYMMNKENNKDVKLYFLYNKTFKSKKILTKEYVLSIFLDKYNVTDEDFKNIIFLRNYTEIMRYKFKNVLILDNHTYHYCDGLIVAEEYHIIVDPFVPSKVNYKNLEKRKNHFLYSELLLYKDELEI